MSTITKHSRIGLLGGTFDPIHNGHLTPAQKAFEHFSLDTVLVIPAHKPPHKCSTNASTKHRVKMVELVCNNEKRFELDLIETQRTTLSYTVDTLKEIKLKHPNSELFFIMGMDSLLTFTHWHLWQDILLQCHLIVNARPGYDLLTVNSETKKLLEQHQISSTDYEIKFRNNTAKKSGYILLHNTEAINISSTEIRINIKENRDCSKWLPEEVIQYINTHRLYKKL